MWNGSIEPLWLLVGIQYHRYLLDSLTFLFVTNRLPNANADVDVNALLFIVGLVSFHVQNLGKYYYLMRDIGARRCYTRTSELVKAWT